MSEVDIFREKLNTMLIEVYHNIMGMEEAALKSSGRLNLSISEMHLIECVGKVTAGLTISEIAEAMSIKSPSVTVAVKKLEKKGYLEKRTGKKDGRVVQVYLTRDGQQIYEYHRFYHRMMAKEISVGLTGEEKEVLIKTLDKLNQFFKKSIGEKI